MNHPQVLRKLINELVKLPTIGEKTAVRLAYHIALRPGQGGVELSDAVREAIEKIHLCPNCFGITESETICDICSDTQRMHTLICVVEKPTDVLAVERCGNYHGLYHVLHGLWSPLRGVGPNDTKLGDLIRRLRSPDPVTGERCEEVVIATGTTVEGDATALYIAGQLAEMGIRSSRIAQGLPKGGELEFVDDITLNHAMAGRKFI